MNFYTRTLLALGSALMLAQPPQGGASPAGAPPAGQAARRPPRDMSKMIPPLEETGFVSIFDGKTLAGWEADTAFFRVENGTLIGETAADKQPKQNTFAIWRGGKPANFELKLDYKLTGYNSGVQFRSVELPDLKFAMKGYQADMDGAQTFTGQLYEERGRGFLALRGQASYIGEGGKPGLIGTLGDNAALKEFIKGDDWNSLHIIARGNTIIQILNGHVMSMIIDDDAAGRKLDGLLGIQCHTGLPMKIEVKNVRLKQY